MKKAAIILATALAPLVSKGSFANISQIKDHTNHQITLTITDHPKQDKNTFYVTNEQSYNGIHNEPDTVVDHQTFISTSVDDIIKTFGQVKGMELIKEHLLIEINTFRQQNNLPPFVIDTLLSGCAQQYAERINNLDYAHSYPKEQRHIDKKTKTNPVQRAAKLGYPSTVIGEIITYTANSTTIQQAMVNRKKSPSHRATLLKTTYTGIAIGQKDNYWVINLGNPNKISEF